MYSNIHKNDRRDRNPYLNVILVLIFFIRTICCWYFQIDSKVISGWSRNDSSYENKTLNPCFNAKMEFPDDMAKIDSKCDYLFSNFDLDDAQSGAFLLVISLFLLCLAMIMIVRILNSLMKGEFLQILSQMKLGFATIMPSFFQIINDPTSNIIKLAVYKKKASHWTRL